MSNENKEFPPEILEKLKAVEVEILLEIIRICKKHSIDYFLAFGTLLGAIRHGGFIPWDDDIDICLLRKDYDRFFSILPQELDPQYEFLTGETNPEFPQLFGKVMKKGTSYPDDSIPNAKFHMGIFVDVFSLENASENERQLKKQLFRSWFWSKLLLIRATPFPKLPYTGVVRGLIYMVCVPANFVLRWFPSAYFRKKAQKWERKFNGQETKRVTYLYGTKPGQYVWNRNDIYPLTTHVFESVEMAVPRNAGKILELSYGSDYMMPPPVEKRYTHYTEGIDFGE